MRGPAADPDAENQRGRRRDGPPHPGPQLDDVLVPPGVLDALPDGVTGSGEWGVVRFRRTLEPLFEFRVFVLVHHFTHSPAKSDSATRNFARARDSCAFDVPVSTPNAAPISSCV